MGRIRNTESVLYDLCPHDLSLILALAGSQPTVIPCAGASHMTSSIVDFLTVTSDLPTTCPLACKQAG